MDSLRQPISIKLSQPSGRDSVKIYGSIISSFDTPQKDYCAGTDFHHPLGVLIKNEF